MKKKRAKRLWLYREKWRNVGAFCQQVCDVCNEPLLMYYEFDALCCPRCNTWKENKCSDPSCEFCSLRPDYPSAALLNAKYKPQYNFFIKRYESRFKRQNRRTIKTKIKENKNKDITKGKRKNEV